MFNLHLKIKRCWDLRVGISICILSAFLLLFANLHHASGQAFDVEIEVDPAEVEALQVVEFTAVVKGAAAKSYLWKLGDSTECTDQICIHIYQRGGRTYTVSLTVVSETGDTVTKTLHLNVQKAAEGCPV